MPSVVTANDLRTGAVVYLASEDVWVDSVDDAAVATTPEELKALEASALAAVEQNKVTAVYAFDVAIVNGRTQPQSVRERIRAAHAPSI